MFEPQHLELYYNASNDREHCYLVTRTLEDYDGSHLVDKLAIHAITPRMAEFHALLVAPGDPHMHLRYECQTEEVAAASCPVYEHAYQPWNEITQFATLQLSLKGQLDVLRTLAAGQRTIFVSVSGAEGRRIGGSFKTIEGAQTFAKGWHNSSPSIFTIQNQRVIWLNKGRA